MTDLNSPEALSITRVHLRNGSERQHREELYLGRRRDGSLMLVSEEYQRGGTSTRRELGDEVQSGTAIDQLLNKVSLMVADGWNVDMVSTETLAASNGPMSHFAINRPKATQHDRLVLKALIESLGSPRSGEECDVPDVRTADDVDQLKDGTSVAIHVGSNVQLNMRIGHGRRVVFSASAPSGSLCERFLAIVATSALGFEVAVQDNDQELVDLQSVLRQPGQVPGWMQKFAERLGVTTRPMTPAVRMYRGQQIAPIVF